MGTCADTGGGAAFDCTSNGQDGRTQLVSGAVTCADQQNGCAEDECCTLPAGTIHCGDKDGNTGGVFDCAADSDGAGLTLAKTIDPLEKCADQNTGCTPAECCEKPQTCADTGGGAAFDCASNGQAGRTQLVSGAVTCADQQNGCAEDECCTLPAGTIHCGDKDGNTGGVFDCAADSDGAGLT